VGARAYVSNKLTSRASQYDGIETTSLTRPFDARIVNAAVDLQPRLTAPLRFQGWSFSARSVRPPYALYLANGRVLAVSAPISAPYAPVDSPRGPAQQIQFRWRPPILTRGRNERIMREAFVSSFSLFRRFGAQASAAAGALLVVHYIVRDVFPLLVVDASVYGPYWSQRYVFIAHTFSGSLALLVGPLQFLPTLRRGYAWLHRWLGLVYLLAVFSASCSAFVLALRSTAPWTVTTALFAANVAWVVGVAIVFFTSKKDTVLHAQWATRTYLLTFGFISFRLLRDFPYFPANASEEARTTTAIWLAWILPWFAAEVAFTVERLSHRSARGAVRPSSVLPSKAEVL
jgi:hypothetical protein